MTKKNKKTDKEIELEVVKLLEEQLKNLTPISTYINQNINKGSNQALRDARSEFNTGLDSILDAYRLVLKDNL